MISDFFADFLNLKNKMRGNAAFVYIDSFSICIYLIKSIIIAVSFDVVQSSEWYFAAVRWLQNYKLKTIADWYSVTQLENKVDIWQHA